METVSEGESPLAMGALRVILQWLKAALSSLTHRGVGHHQEGRQTLSLILLGAETMQRSIRCVCVERVLPFGGWGVHIENVDGDDFDLT